MNKKNSADKPKTIHPITSKTVSSYSEPRLAINAPHPNIINNNIAIKNLDFNFCCDNVLTIFYKL